MSGPNNPVADSYPGRTRPALSKTTFVIAGIETHVYGLAELSADATSVSCLWLLHPRLETYASMEHVAYDAIGEFNAAHRPSLARHGLVAVSFDQRNHGSRLQSQLANEAWRQGNPRHAQDMFSIVSGTAADVSLLIAYLPAYIFTGQQAPQPRLTQHLVFGVSLGGHAGWQCILHDPRVTAAVIVVGCADYTRLMCHRAMKSKLEAWTRSTPPGAQFVGSEDFPDALVEAVAKLDPSGLLLGAASSAAAGDESAAASERDAGAGLFSRSPSAQELDSVVAVLDRTLRGKRVLNLAGGADKLVPHECSALALGWLQRAIAPGSWYAGRGVVLEDRVFEGVGHQMTPEMARAGRDFVIAAVIDHCSGAGPNANASSATVSTALSGQQTHPTRTPSKI